MLTYMPRDKVRHEYVSVTPDGFRFRRQNFESLNLLMKWFKVSFVMIFLTEQKLNNFRRRNTSETRSPGLRTLRAEAAVPGPRTVESLLAGADQPAGLLRAP